MCINLALERNIPHSKQSFHLSKKLRAHGTHAIGAFLDVRQAFDTVPHDILLKMMYAFGIVGSALKLPKRYLTDRTQSKIYGGIQSVTLPISCRVPQSSKSKD